MDLRGLKTKTVDVDGAVHERILRLKRSRSGSKAAVTRRQRELLELMKSSDNVDQVRAKFLDLEVAMRHFNEAHDKYHAELTDESAIRDSIEYFESVKRMGTAVFQSFDVWLQSAQFKLQEELDLAISLHPEDSISNISSTKSKSAASSRRRKSKSSASSSLSQSSTASSAGLRASAKKAALSVEVAALKTRQDIQLEELLLKQKKENFELETKLAKADAEEKVYSYCEERRLSTLSSQLPTLHATKKESTVDKPEGQESHTLTLAGQFATSTPGQVEEKETVEAPVHQTEENQEVKCSPLNPDAPVWKGYGCSPSAINGESAEGGLLEQHLDLSDKNVSHVIEVQKMQQQQNQQLQELLKQHQLQTLAMTLPQPEISVFSGDPVEYSDFVRAFENLIESKTSSPNSRLYYLVQYTSGEVKELMQSCLSMDPKEGYKTARALLKDRYGQSYKIATALIDRVTKTPQIKSDDGPALQRYSVVLTSCKNSLKEIGYLNKIENPDTLQRIIGRLPLWLRQRWREKADYINEELKREVTIGDVAEFVEAKARIANHPVFGDIHSNDDKNNAVGIGSKRRYRTPSKEHKGSAFTTQGTTPESTTDPPKDNTERAPDKSNVKCPLCKESHWLSRCQLFRGKSVDERISFVRSRGLCDNCLVAGHMAMSCPKKSFCQIVGCKIGHRKHSTFLHPKNDKPVKAPTPSVSETQSSNTENENQNGQARSCFTEMVACEGVCSATGAGASATGLAIVPVNVRAEGREKMVQTYAFLDPGSNTTFCTDKLIERLGATGRKAMLSLTTMDSDNVKSESLVVNLEVSDLQGRNVVELSNVFSRVKLPVTVDDMPVQSDVERWFYLKDIDLPCIDADIELLIGSDVPELLEPHEVQRSEDGGPYAVRTLLGWTINGPLGRASKAARTSNRIQSHVVLDQQFVRFCEMEFNDSQFSIEKGLSQDDKRALAIMEDSAELCGGHYEVALPWKVFPPDLPNNKIVAEHRLGLLKKRLLKDPQLHRKYSLFMDDLFDKGHAQKVPEGQREDSPSWYLPHHPVIHPQKPDKVRVVFDCAAKFQNVSLNQQILQGPDLTNSLIGVLTRFREQPIAIMADIEKMFYQVRVPIEDSRYLRFLWWPSGEMDKEPEEFQMLVHLFGGVSSPSCANYALQKTAEDNAEHFDKDTIQTVRRNFYVDDCLKSVEDNQQASRLVDQLRQLLAKGGFRLTKWVSNAYDVIQSVPVSERASSVKELDLENLPVERALGILWDVQSDTFRFKIAVKDRPPTRRGILSVISSIYDPLGFVAPLILPAKAILRDLCRKGLDWDDRIPLEDLKRWQDWLQELPKLEQFAVERCLRPKNFGRIVSSQLHNFSDASGEGYGAVTYLRVVNEAGNVHCAFLMGKSRQTPQKSVTIPRLELSAAVVATRLNKMMQHELDVALEEEFFWTDSTCVLSYITNKEKRFQTFVANRITTIHEGSRPDQWNYVDTDSNPADDASRGLSAEDIIHQSRWINGPPFLWEAEDRWPKRPEISVEIKEDDPEVKRERKTFSVASTVEADFLNRVVQSCSSWYKLKKLMAWILRYRSNLLRECRRRKEGTAKVLVSEIPSPISVEEMHSAEIEVLKYVQRQCFREELVCLQGKESKVELKKSVRARRTGSVKKSSSIAKLDPELRDDLLCVGGRLRHAPIEQEQRHPVILPKKHHVVDLIVRHYHLLSGHSGQEYVLSLIRKSYWIIKGRVAVRRVVNRCFSCRRRQAPFKTQKMADLPADRVTPNKPPFSFVGVDCFGPFWVKRARSQVKRYGVLYTCLATRAIHLEVAQSMDTDSFLNSMRRFIARRGVPEVMRSDNGSNFVGGCKELREAISGWNKSQIHEFLLQRNVKWLFNPPSGSHFGGVWERCIRTVRKILVALMKEQPLDDEGLTTLMCEVESIVNGRPITKSSDDPSDSEALTPSHLLLLRSGPRLPPGVFRKEDGYSRRRWRQVQYLADVFWRRWIREYLPQLQERQKWTYPSRNFAVDDIVLVVDDRVPRSSWPLGRIISVRKNSTDEHVRSVTVKTRTSQYDRPVDKIVLLESVEMSEGMKQC